MGSTAVYGRASNGWLGYDGSRDGAAAVAESVALPYSATRRLKVVALSATVVAMVYMTATPTLRLVIGTVSGNTITWGTPITVVSATIMGFDIAMVSASKLLIGYSNDSGDGTLKTYTVSGTTPTINATTAYMSSGDVDARLGVCGLSSTRGILARADSVAEQIVGLTIGSGTLVIDGTPDLTTNIWPTRPPALCRISATKAALAYATGGNVLETAILTDSGTAITAGTVAALISVDAAIQADFVGLDSDGVSVGAASIYRKNATAGGCLVAPFSWSGTTITSPANAAFTTDAFRAGFPLSEIAYMQSVAGVPQFLLAQGNWLSGRPRIGSLAVPAITTPVTGGARDSFGYIYGTGDPIESHMSIAKLSSTQAIAAFASVTNRYPSAMVVNL